MLKFPNSPKKLINVLCRPQYKIQNYFQGQRTKFLKKGTPCEFDFK